MIAHTEMSSPICMGDTARSAAISGMSPAGSDSAVTVTSTPKLRIRRGRSGKRATGADAGAEAVEIVMMRG
nr:hypothetical protein GCM10025699_11350 [Microbacterium flavescens]